MRNQWDTTSGDPRTIIRFSRGTLQACYRELETNMQEGVQLMAVKAKCPSSQTPGHFSEEHT